MRADRLVRRCLHPGRGRGRYRYRYRGSRDELRPWEESAECAAGGIDTDSDSDTESSPDSNPEGNQPGGETPKEALHQTGATRPIGTRARLVSAPAGERGRSRKSCPSPALARCRGEGARGLGVPTTGGWRSANGPRVNAPRVTGVGAGGKGVSTPPDGRARRPVFVRATRVRRPRRIRAAAPPHRVRERLHPRQTAATRDPSLPRRGLQTRRLPGAADKSGRGAAARAYAPSSAPRASRRASLMRPLPRLAAQHLPQPRNGNGQAGAWTPNRLA